MTLTTYAWRRTVAFFLDCLLIAVYLGVLSVVFLALPAATAIFADRATAQLSGFLLVTLPAALYFAFSESSSMQASWGKARNALRVCDNGGQRITAGRALARTLLKFVPWEISHTLVWEAAFNPGLSPTLLNGAIVAIYALLGANAVSIMLTRSRQSLYDLVCGTRVAAV